MSKLPVISGMNLVKYLVPKLNCTISRQRGSHLVLRLQDNRLVAVPLHEELKTGTLLGILEIVGITREVFIQEYGN